MFFSSNNFFMVKIVVLVWLTTDIAKNIGTLGKYDQRRLWKLLILLIIYKIKKHKNLTFHWIMRF